MMDNPKDDWAVELAVEWRAYLAAERRVERIKRCLTVVSAVSAAVAVAALVRMATLL
jgi:hypothetical protein